MQAKVFSPINQMRPNSVGLYLFLNIGRVQSLSRRKSICVRPLLRSIKQQGPASKSLIFLTSCPDRIHSTIGTSTEWEPMQRPPAGFGRPRERHPDIYELSAHLEALFREEQRGAADDTSAQVRAAAALGIPAVEILWWREKNLDELARTLEETGVALETICSEPMGALVDPEFHETFIAGLVESAAAAERLKYPYLVTTAGDGRAGVPRLEQREAVVRVLRTAGQVLTTYNVTLLLENLNSRVDHVGTFLDTTDECLDVIEEVDSPHVRLLYDLYHSLVMDERPDSVLADRTDLVGHVQIADVPGRHEPGTGKVDWRYQLRSRKLGYSGRIGLEYIPTADTAKSLQHIRAVASDSSLL